MDEDTRYRRGAIAAMARTTEKALLSLPDLIKALMLSLSMLQERIQKGERIEQGDREVTIDRMVLVKLELNRLLGDVPDTRHKQDREAAQRLVEEFVKELIENADDISVGILRGLQSTDPLDRTRKSVIWKRREVTEQRTAVNIPDVILEDDCLMSGLESRLSEFCSELVQDPEEADGYEYDVEIMIED